MAFVDNLSGVLLVLGLAREGKGVFGFAIRDFVDPISGKVGCCQHIFRVDMKSMKFECLPEPFVGGTDQAREMPLNILDIVELRSKRVRNVNDDDFPVSLTLIEKGHDAENLDLLDLSNIADLFTNLANIEWVVITLGFGLGMGLRRVFPGLYQSRF